MKRILFFLTFLLSAVFASAQQPDTTHPFQSINVTPGYIYKGLKAGLQFTPPQNDTAYKLAVADSGSITFFHGAHWKWTGHYWAALAGNGVIDSTNLINDSTRRVYSGGGYFDIYIPGISIASVAQIARDSIGAAITALTGDVTATGPGSATATLANVLLTPGTYTNINATVDAKGRIIAIASGGAGTPYYNSNIGAGYRLAVPNTNNIKTLQPGVWTTIDSTTNANAITIGNDSAAAVERVREIVGDSVQPAQNIQQVLTTGDTTLRKIVLKDTGNVAADHALNWFNWRPSNYNTTYPGYGTQGLFNSGFSFNMINPGSSRPDVVATIFGYNVALQGGSPLIGTEASYAQILETHYEVGADQLFERYDQIIPTSTGVAKRPFGYYMNKQTGFTRFNSEIDAFNLFTWNKDTVGFAISDGGGGLMLKNNGNFVFKNARFPNNQITTTLADDGPTISGTGINANAKLSFISPVRISTAAGGSGGALQIDGIPDGGNGINILAGTTTGSNVPLNIFGSADGGMGTSMQNITTNASSETYSIKRASGGIITDYMIDGTNKFYRWRMAGNAGNGILSLAHNTGTIVEYDGLNYKTNIYTPTYFDANIGIGITNPGVYGLNINRAVRINKDSVTLQFSLGTNMPLIIDTATGKIQRIASSSLGTSYTFSTGLTNSSGTVTNDLITGKAGSQTVIGGTGAGENLILRSTSHGTKGAVQIGSNAAGTVSLLGLLTLSNTISSSTSLTLDNSSIIWISTNAGAATWTLPDISSSSLSGAYYILKNAGTNNITLNAAAGDDIYASSSSPSATITPGQTLIILSDATSRWYALN